MDFLDVALQQMSFKDLVDILVVAILIYQVLLIVHGTRAVQMLFGILFLVGLFWVGLSYKLFALNWILTHFFDSFFVIFIILFQEEIRSALVSFGTGRKVWGVFNKETNELEIEEIIEVSGVLSREKTGALIVFERNNGLSNYIETGTDISAKVHSDLIYSLFQTNSPLHDGAIVIKEGRIAAAGCFLPLSKNVEIDRHFGTRHRAALGVSEVSDAVVIIVSEESGKINLCIDGVFYECKNENHLRQYLKHLWANEKLDNQLVPLHGKDLMK